MATVGRAARGVFLTCIFAAPGAMASEPTASDKETSRGLYAEGMRLLDTHDYVAAERACRGAHALVQAPTSSSCWARSLEGLGRLLEAREAFLEAARYQSAPNEPQVFTAAREAARLEAVQLAARIPSIVLVVTGAPADVPITATIDGSPVASETVGLPRRVNPGPHVIVVAAAGFRQSRVEMTAGEAHEQRVTVELQPGPDAGAGPPSLKGEPVAPRAGPPLASYIAFGAGALGVAVGIASGMAAGSKDKALAAECSGSSCPASAQGDLDAFHTLKGVSTAFYVLGAAGAIGGATLWLTAPTHRQDRPATGLWLGPTSAGIRGAF
jgi:hypothetical protein